MTDVVITLLDDHPVLVGLAMILIFALIDRVISVIGNATRRHDDQVERIDALTRRMTELEDLARHE